MTDKIIQAVIGACLFAASVAACAFVRAPTAAELVEFREERKAVLLLQFVVKEPDGTPIKPFDNLYFENNLRLVLGDFETGGVPIKLVYPRFLSAESRDKGWIYLLLSPGTYYLTVFRTVEKLKFAPRWFIDIPDDASTVYGGSLYFVGERGWLFPGGDIVERIDADRSTIHNEEVQARELASDYLGHHGPLRTVLMERHKTDTFILRTPSR